MNKVVDEIKPLVLEPQNASTTHQKTTDHKKHDDGDMTKSAKEMDAAKQETLRPGIINRYIEDVEDNDEKSGDPARRTQKIGCPRVHQTFAYELNKRTGQDLIDSDCTM
jgi:hypothetical protein